ncbi:squamous cell carcinoma antigen recognized by T-cells 3 isoform X2 [Telopea speciosissima]|uniref:squamous cell carcinoma antigen recognized by T-cells 3 isoform X2 n=1 Tax=Telopea speciosissima TaxID=54955 RepID=UPI001CC6C45C|nr:squamous cell carcinoma antigen recognized by T-cells 3 isoform X2 [Telopea speciosissima]
MAETSDMEVKTLEKTHNEVEVDTEMENPSSSDSESESESESDDDVEDLRVEALEKELAENPSSYETHVQYIKSLRRLGHIEKLREARESMNALFPLTPAMWQEWVKDEASLSTGPETSVVIEKLFERGLHEYLSVSLWCDCITYVQENDPSVHEYSPAGILKMRNLFERALTAAGLHVVEGNKIWEAYRKFEQAFIHTIDDSDREGKEKQVNRIRGIFHRQLSLPLADLRSTLFAYKAWEVEQGTAPEVDPGELDGVPSNVVSAYQKAIEMYNARVHHEEKICKQDASDMEKLQHYMTYLKFEQSCGDPARIQILYERAITEFPLSSDIWLDYTRFLDHTLKVPSVARDVYSRAIRNCSWIGELWSRYLLSLERGHASKNELSAVFEQSLQCTFSSIEEYLDLYLTRIDGLRRRISLTGPADDALDYALIRDTFQHAADYLSQYLKAEGGLLHNLHLHAYWARLELKFANDPVAARGVWESLLKTSSSMIEAWKGYIGMEIEMGHIHEARSIYRRCYSKRFNGTGSEDICHSWLRFEREYGTLGDFDHALRKVTPRLEELKLFISQQQATHLAAPATQKERAPAKNLSQKRGSSARLTDEQNPPKRQKGVFQKDSTQKSGTKKDRLNEVKANKPENSDEQQVNDSGAGKTKLYSDECTVFISNLGLEANEGHLRDFFSDIGGVTDIRILKDKFTRKSRGLAYVDFSDSTQLGAAVLKNRQTLLGKKLSIARSDPKRSQKKVSFGASTAPDHGAGHEEPIAASKESTGPHKSSSVSKRREDRVQLKGKNTFAVPRNLVRPLGWSKNEQTSEEDEKPKSNDEFRDMLLKSNKVDK